MPTSIELLRNSLEEWQALAGRRLKPEGIDVWVRKFASVHPRVLDKALEIVTERFERMPGPGHLTNAIREVRDISPVGLPEEYRFARDTARDVESGEDVEVLIDQKKPLEPLYRAMDCQEGREFINTLHGVAGRKTIPFPKPISGKQQEAERQRQKREYAAYRGGAA